MSRLSIGIGTKNTPRSHRLVAGASLPVSVHRDVAPWQCSDLSVHGSALPGGEEGRHFRKLGISLMAPGGGLSQAGVKRGSRFPGGRSSALFHRSRRHEPGSPRAACAGSENQAALATGDGQETASSLPALPGLGSWGLGQPETRSPAQPCSFPSTSQDLELPCCTEAEKGAHGPAAPGLPTCGKAASALGLGVGRWECSGLTVATQPAVLPADGVAGF